MVHDMVQRKAVCISVLQCAAMWYPVLHCDDHVLQCRALFVDVQQ
jgi:hypothetical protein